MNREKWLKLGVALTLTWLIIGGILAYRITEAELPVVKTLVERCLVDKGGLGARACDERAATIRASAETSSVLEMTAYIGFPLLVGWSAGVVLFFVGDRVLSTKRARSISGR